MLWFRPGAIHATLFACLLTALPNTSAASTGMVVELSPEIHRLLDLIEHRAQLMPDVARWKWQRDLPVTDPAREQTVLARSTRAAVDAGIDPAGARALMAAQMAVARDIQHSHFQRFEQEAPPMGGPDLHTDLRRAISATTTAILEILPTVLPLLPERRVQLNAALDGRLAPLGATPPAIASLAEALTVLRPAPVPGNTLERILTNGVLRIGTTLDYPPFSFIGADGEPDGIDVALARRLAASLDARAEFVTTSWPTLMTDLTRDHFDIGMSGISRTLARARVAAFSAPYHSGGKTPIIRCSDRDRLGSLASIDHEAVRAVVNPGGTNEIFTRKTLTEARIRVFEDNTRIFTEIAEGRADVMFTDAIEVQLQTAKDPRLCPALPGRTLTFQEKGFLLPAEDDGAWRRYVDLWLATLQGEGTLQALFGRYLEQQ